MTKCLFKALKAVDLEKHVGLFRSLGYESAGALAHFRAEHFNQLNFNEQELLRLIALLDVLKDATRDGKICPHYFTSSKGHPQQSNIKSVPIHASWSDETVPQRNSQSNLRKPPKRSMTSVGITGRSSSTAKPPSNEFLPSRSSTVLSRQHPITPTKNQNQRFLGSKSFLNRPAVQHVKVKSYNYGIPTNRRPRPNHGSFFVSSPRHNNDLTSYAKPAEIYVYARKRPLLPAESNFQDTIAVPDNKRIIITENKANLDCTPLLKKTEFQFDHVFGSTVSNKEIFDSTVFPLISINQRHNLTYICFGQTGSGKSHTIFGGKNNDGLLVYCTQMLLKESMSTEKNLICSFYEIYNNQVYDLVNTGKRLFVREDGAHHVNVIGITELLLRSVDDLRCVIDDGLTRRHHGKSAFNSNSSRSHAIFQIILKNNSDASESFRLIFIDLAGSERATDAQNNQRQTRREGAQINWSLLALKECIRSMDLTHSHAPFRQSKLTHILRDSLVGSKTRTCLMANVSPPDDCCQCSLNTLQYASRIRDISMRHRHRSVPTGNHIQTNYSDEQEKPRPSFKPATSSTPVHRLLPAFDQRIYTSTKPTDLDTRLTKPLDIDWQIADDDHSISADDHHRHPPKSSTRDFMINSNLQNNYHHHPIARLPSKTTTKVDDSPSSYFPAPQSDIKKPSSKETKSSFDSSRLMYDGGNERQWKTVPAPPITTPRPVNSSQATRMIPVAPVHTSDDNPYNSTTGTESLGTKITKVANHEHGNQQHKKSSMTDSLNLQKQYDTGAITTDTEPMLYSDRQETPRDESGFFNHRDELLSIVSSRLTPAGKRSSSVNTSKNSKIRSSTTNKFQHSRSSPAKTRPIKSASSTSSLASLNQEKKPSSDSKKSKLSSSMHLQKFDPTLRRSSNRHHHHHRAVPLRGHHSSDSEELEKSRRHTHRRKANSSKNTSHSTRSEACQTIEEPKMNTELITPIPSPLSASSFEQVKQPVSTLSSENIINPWPITTSFSSPSKDFGVRVSDQLNALRTLLENRLIGSNEVKREKKKSSVLQTSPGTFARQFLQSFRQTTYQNNITPELNSDDDDDREVERTFPSNNEKTNVYEGDLFSTSTTSCNHRAFASIHQRYEAMIQPSLSSLSDELNQARAESTVTPTSSLTIASNLAAKIDTQEPRIQSSETEGNHSHPTTNENHPKGRAGTDTEQTSQNPSSRGSSSNHSPSTTPLHAFDLANHDHLLDTEKESSLLIGSSFDALLNSLKTMREKDLNFLVRNSDEKLIPVAD